MAQYEEVIKLSVEEKGNSTQTVKNLRTELREAKDEAVQIGREFGKMSPKAVEAAKRVADLQNEMGDLNKQVKALNPNKFEVIAGVASGIAGGIAAAQGAMALFGAESEDTHKALLKVQAAMAFASGVQQLLNMKESLGTLATMLKTNLVNAFKSVATASRAAGAAMGYGLILIAITAIVANWEKIVKFIGLGKSENEKLLDVQKKQVEESEYDYKLMLSKENQLRLNGVSERKILEYRIEQLRVLYEERKGILETSRAVADDLAKKNAKSKKGRAGFFWRWYYGASDEDLAASNADIKEQELALAEMLANINGFTLQIKAIDDGIERDKKAAAKKSSDARQKAADDRKAQEDANRQKELNSLSQYITDRFNAEQGADAAREQARNEFYDRSIGNEDKYYALQKSLGVQAHDNMKKIGEQNVENERRNAEAIRSVRMDTLNSTSSILGSMAQIFGKHTAASKAFALAQIATDTAMAIMHAQEQAQANRANSVTYGLAGAAQFAAVLAAILSAVARAKSIMGAGSSGGSGGGYSASSYNPQPNAIPRASSGFNQGSDRLQGTENKYKVYVVENDITKTQRRVQVNQFGATF